MVAKLLCHLFGVAVLVHVPLQSSPSAWDFFWSGADLLFVIGTGTAFCLSKPKCLKKSLFFFSFCPEILINYSGPW